MTDLYNKKSMEPDFVHLTEGSDKTQAQINLIYEFILYLIVKSR